MTLHDALVPLGIGIALLVAGLWLARFGVRLLRGSLSTFGEGVDQVGSGPSPVAALAPGWAELIGTAKTGEEGTFEAPLSGDDVVLSVNRLTWTFKPPGAGSNRSRRSVEAIESVPFALRDETGTVRAELDDPARYHLGRPTVDGEDPPGAQQWEARQEFEDQEPVGVERTRYQEWTVEPGEEVYVFGEVREREGGGAGDDLVVTAGEPDAMRAVVSTEGRKSPAVGAFGGSILGGVLAVGATLLGVALSLVGLLLVLVGFAGVFG